MLNYNPNLKHIARGLRSEMTGSELLLWSRLRRKQLLDLQFYRQKPIGNHVVDFYAPNAKLVVEVDGSQHLGLEHRQNDGERDAYLTSAGLQVLRFSNTQVLQEIDAIVDAILKTLSASSRRNPPIPPFNKGGLRLTADR